MSGLLSYFDQGLRQLLLYQQEVQQHDEVRMGTGRAGGQGRAVFPAAGLFLSVFRRGERQESGSQPQAAQALLPWLSPPAPCATCRPAGGAAQQGGERGVRRGAPGAAAGQAAGAGAGGHHGPAGVMSQPQAGLGRRVRLPQAGHAWAASVQPAHGVLQTPAYNPLLQPFEAFMFLASLAVQSFKLPRPSGAKAKRMYVCVSPPPAAQNVVTLEGRLHELMAMLVEKQGQVRSRQAGKGGWVVEQGRAQRGRQPSLCSMS